MQYKFYSDSGHAWLKVPMAHLKRLGIMYDISEYSYMRMGYAYLEEDSDAGKFIDALKKTGKPFQYIECNTDRKSRIRSYEKYNILRLDKSYPCSII